MLEFIAQYAVGALRGKEALTLDVRATHGSTLDSVVNYVYVSETRPSYFMRWTLGGGLRIGAFGGRRVRLTFTPLRAAMLAALVRVYLVEQRGASIPFECNSV